MLLPTALAWVQMHPGLDRMWVVARTTVEHDGMFRALETAGIAAGGDPATLNVEVKVGRACPQLAIYQGPTCISAVLLAPLGLAS